MANYTRWHQFAIPDELEPCECSDILGEIGRNGSFEAVGLDKDWIFSAEYAPKYKKIEPAKVRENYIKKTERLADLNAEKAGAVFVGKRCTSFYVMDIGDMTLKVICTTSNCEIHKGRPALQLINW